MILFNFSLLFLIIIDKQIKAYKQEEKSHQKRETMSKIEKYKKEFKSNNIDDTIDIDQYLKDKKRKRTNVMQIMQKERQQKAQSKGKKKFGKNNKRPGKQARKYKRRK